jgi:hypothetical protein
MKHPIAKVVLPITLSAFLLAGCQSPSISVSSSSLSQPSTVTPTATASPMPEKPASSTPTVENPQDTSESESSNIDDSTASGSASSDIKDEPYLSSQDLQVPVPDFLTDEQKLLYLRAYKMMLIRIGTYAIDDTQYFPCDNPDTTRTYTDTISVDGYEYTPALNHYRQWDSFYSTLRGIFTEGFLDSDYLSFDGVTYFRPIEGNMYYISTERGFDPGYNQDSTSMDFTLQEETPDKIVIQVTTTYAIDESSSQAFRQAVLDGLISNTKNYSITLVRSDDGWRFSQFNVPY